MAEFAGYEALAEREITHECAGALVLQQREFMKFQEIASRDLASKTMLRDYQRAHPKGLTRYGLIALIERATFGGSVLDPTAMAAPELDDNEIGYALLDGIVP